MTDNVPAVSNAASVPTGANVLTLANGLKFTIAKQVTRTVLAQEDNIPFYVTFQTAAIEAEVLVNNAGRKAANDMGPPRICNVENLENGAQQTLIMNAVLEAELDRNYPDQSYVGRSFAIRRQAHHKDDKRYKTYQIAEIIVNREAETVEVARQMPNPALPDKKKGAKE